MIVIAGLREAQSIVVPFVLSAFIAILAVPPLVALRKLRVPAALSLTLILGGILVLGTVVAALVGSSIADFTSALPRYNERLDQLSLTLVGALSRFGVDGNIRDLILQRVDPSAAFQVAGVMLSQLGNVLSQGFLIFLTVAFMLAEANSLPGKIQMAFGSDERVSEAVDDFIRSLNQYVGIKTLISLMTGITVSLCLVVLDVDFPVLWGVLAFLLNYVPNLGALLAAIPAVLLALVQHSVGTAVLVGICYGAIGMVYGNILEPRLMGKELGLSTLVVFLSLVFWGWVLGPVGMILSVPLTMAVKIGLENREQTRWLSLLLSGSSVTKSK